MLRGETTAYRAEDARRDLVKRSTRDVATLQYMLDGK